MPQYVFVLTQFGCNFVKAGKGLVVGEEHEEKKKIALPNVIPRNQTCTAFLSSTLCVCV